MYQPPPSQATTNSEEQSAAAADPVVVELQSILTGIVAKEPKIPLIVRLRDLTLTGSEAEADLLILIAACHGWGKIVATLKRPITEAEAEAAEVKAAAAAQKAAAAEKALKDEADLRSTKPPGLPDGWRDPTGWICSTTGIYRVKKVSDIVVSTQVTTGPLWISRRWKDVETKDGTVEVRWPGGSQIVPRAVAMDIRGIQTLANQYAPVDGTTARAAVQWLGESEKHNHRAVPIETSTSRLGWTETAEGVRALQTPAGPHMLRPPEGDGRSIASTIRTAGTFKGWQKVAMEVHRSPVAAIMLAASVASVILEATGAENFLVDLCGKSSRGKTTALRWAASAWGDPAEKGGYLSKWNSTQVFIERKGAFLNSLPLCLDDTKQLTEKGREELKNIIYMWSGGQGRGRGSVTGTCETATWGSILLSTGESPLSVIGGQHEGMKLRVVTLNELPWADGDLTAVNLMKGLEHYGWIGPMVAAWTVEHWDGLKARWEQRRDKVRSELGSGHDRLSEYVATLALAANALVACGVPMPLAEMQDMLYKAAKSSLAGSDIAGEAFLQIGEWLEAHPDRISGATARTEVPNAGWIGRVIGTGVVAVLPDKLDSELKRLGYVPAEVKPRWAERGFIAKGKDGSKIPTRMSGEGTPRMYHLKIEGYRLWRAEPPPAPSDSDQPW